MAQSQNSNNPDSLTGQPIKAAKESSAAVGNCVLKQKGILPYDRCRDCQLSASSCVGIQSTVIASTIGFLLALFLFIDNPFYIRLNIVVILSLLMVLGYRFNSTIDKLHIADRINKSLTQKLKNHAGELKIIASQDDLTGLANRRELEHRLEQVLTQSRRTGDSCTLCFMDLDRFKLVNDSCGHAAGDHLLQQVTSIITKIVRDTDLAARLGGDEFAILFYQCDVDSAVIIAERIRSAIEDYRFVWDGKHFSIGASIGMMAIDRNSGDLIDIMAAVDEACYAAKEQGRNRIHIYEQHKQDIQQLHKQKHWAQEISSALDNDRFVLHYQEIVPLQQQHERRIFEVLVRMLDREGKLVMPMAFIPAAERYSLMQKLDQWVVNQALQEYHLLSRTGPVKININLSAVSLASDSMLPFMLDRLQHYQVPPEDLCLEITETAAMSNLVSAREFIENIKKAGCSFALDDFGTGMSSFSYLKNLPVKSVKIDGSFIRNITMDEVDHAMVESIVQVCHKLDKVTVAEFVEDEVTIELLRELGVDYAQGYGIGKPVPLDQIS